MPVGPVSWRGDMIWYLGIAVAVGVAFWVGVGARAGAIGGGSMLMATAVLGIGRRRSDVLRIVGGAGDERNRALYTRATAAAGAVLQLLIPGWWLLTVAQGKPNDTLLALTVVSVVSLVVAAFLYSRLG